MQYASNMFRKLALSSDGVIAIRMEAIFQSIGCGIDIDVAQLFSPYFLLCERSIIKLANVFFVKQSTCKSQCFTLKLFNFRFFILQKFF